LLVTGSDGLVGTNILAKLASDFDIIPCVESEWDITDRKKGEEMLGSLMPDVLLNLAAMTDVDACEDRQDLAFRVNGEAAGILADICFAKKIGMVYLSTDYVFDGKKRSPYTEEDRTNPLSVYGRSKRLGEEKVLASHTSALVVRSEWIYGHGGESFITKVVRTAREKGAVEVVDDQCGTPTYAGDLARPIAALVKAGKSGVYHVTNSGSCTWYELAQYIFSKLHMVVECKPVSSVQLNRKAKRPSYSVLDCTKMRNDINLDMRNWQEAVDEYLESNESDILFRRSPHTQ
jgi:dTDP-4-dehydrorhamnose reductase